MPDSTAAHWADLQVADGPLRTAAVNRYVALTALRAFAVTSLALTGLFSLLEFVEQLASVGQGDYHVGNALVYVVLTAPSRLFQLTPISMLLGSLIGLGALARNAELTAMQSLGISQGRIVRSILLTAVPVAAVLFLLAQFVIPATQLSARAGRSAALRASASYHTDDSLWAQSGGQYLNVQRFDPGNVPVGVDIYAFGADNSLLSLLHADTAHVGPDGTWLLSGVVRKHVEQSILRTDRLPTLPWHAFLSPKQLRFLNLPLDSIPPVALYSHVVALRRLGQNATRYEEAFWAQVSIPFSILAMIMVVSPFLFGAARTQSTGRSLVFGVGFGIVFSLVQQILNHLGLLLGIVPAATALAPPLAVMMLAIYLLSPARNGLPRLPGRPAR